MQLANTPLLPTSLPDFFSFESSSTALQLSLSKMSVFNVYRPPSSSNLSKPFSIFLKTLFPAATTPQEFIITGYFNIHLDNPTDHLTTRFLSLLSSFNLNQDVNFLTHNKNHILDLVVTSYDSLAPSLSSTHCCPSDHFPVFTKLQSINPTPFPPPSIHSFLRLHSIDTDSFLTDLK